MPAIIAAACATTERPVSYTHLLNIEERKLEIVGVKGRELAEEEIEKILEERKRAWRPKEEKYKSGVLKIYSEHAVSPMKGGYMR